MNWLLPFAGSKFVALFVPSHLLFMSGHPRAHRAAIQSGPVPWGPKKILAGLVLSVLLFQTQLWAAPRHKFSAGLTDLWVIQTSAYNGNESAIGSALAGFVNSQNGSNMIWQEYGGSNPVILANELQGQGVVIHNVTSVWQLVQQFRGYFNQGIQYTPGDPSINVAFSLCGLWNDIPIEDGEVALAASYGVTIAFNADGLNDAWTFANLWLPVHERNGGRPGAGEHGRLP